MKKHIVVIGGGIAGCAAAYTLQKKGYDVTIVEKNAELGGRIHSEKVGDLTFEMGAVFLTSFYTNVLAFLNETGLNRDLHTRKSMAFIVRNGTQLSMKKWSTYLGSSWLSAGAKTRLIWEIIKLLPAWRKLNLHNIPQADGYDTKSVADNFSGRYGRELLNYLFEPVLNGYMYWSPERTSHAFLMILLKAALKRHRSYILKAGLRQIPERAARGSKVLLSHEVQQIKRATNGSYSVIIQGPAGKANISADGIVCATTASAVPKIIPNLTAQQKEFFASITYSSTVIGSYRIERSDPMPTYAIAYPATEEKPIVAMTVLSDTSKKASMVKVYASGLAGKELAEKSDKEIHDILTESESLPIDVSSAIKSGEWRIQRWPEALPEFNVGHLRQLHAFTNGEIEIPNSNIVFAGDYIGGPFAEGAFTSGVEAANRLNAQLT